MKRSRGRLGVHRKTVHTMGICQTTLTKWSHQVTLSGSPSFASVFQPSGINTGRHGYTQTRASLPPRPRLESPLGPHHLTQVQPLKTVLHTDAKWMIWYPWSITQTLSYDSLRKTQNVRTRTMEPRNPFYSKIPSVLKHLFHFQKPFSLSKHLAMVS